MSTRIRFLILSVVYLASFGLVNVGLAAADGLPYFRAYGADVASGGWFNAGSTVCNTQRGAPGNTYQAPNYLGGTDNKKGGILTFSKNVGAGYVGAGSQFGTQSLGLVEGNPAKNYGFNSDQINTANNALTFANETTFSTTDYQGGYLEGTDEQRHCIPDYYTTTTNPGAIPLTTNSFTVDASTPSNQYVITPFDSTKPVIIGGGTALEGGSAPGRPQHITLRVNAPVVLINGGITYSSPSTYTADTPPKFELIVSGSIWIAHDVAQLDGVYIAQPRATGAVSAEDNGVIWTCHDNFYDKPWTTWIAANCGNKLTFNGAVIARQVILLRVGGSGVDTAGPNEAFNSPNISEVFNLTPETITGGGFGNTPPEPSKIQNLKNLPPVF